MTTTKEIWQKLTDPEYRKLFVEEMSKRAFATQVRTIRKEREWSQERLAKEAGITQGVVSRTEDPSLGKTFDTAAQIASGFDLAFIPKIVTYAEFVRWIEEITQGYTDLPTFQEELSSIRSAEKLTKDLGAMETVGQGDNYLSALQKKPPQNVSDAVQGPKDEEEDEMGAFSQFELEKAS